MTMHELARNEYGLIVPELRDLPINTLFARAVAEGHTEGRVFVDDAHSPRAFYVAHRYGMSLLGGSPGSESFVSSLARYLTGEMPRRTHAEWLQVFPDEWTGVLEALLGARLVRSQTGEAGEDLDGGIDGRVVEHTRVNFRFDPRRYARMRESVELPADCKIVDDLDWIYRTMQGSVVPSVFWDSSAELRERGAAFALLRRGTLASVAFASFAMDDKLELGIETVPRFRGRGFARHACIALIDYCLERSLEPVWACRLTNAGSYRLAVRLGFDHVRSLPYYRLPPSMSEQVIPA